jgi:uncharacterized protein (TIGR03663 family)
VETTQNRSGWLDGKVADWLPVTREIALWILLGLGAAATRFYDLGERAIAHDESLHSFYSWLLYRGQGYVHNPMMHGPLQFHMLALTYFILGASDTTARVPAALFGITAVLLLWVFRRWLGRIGALIASLFMVISPFMLYYSRYVRNEAFTVVWALLMFYAIARFFETRQTKWLYLLTIATVLNYDTEETAYIYVALAMLFLGLQLLISLLQSPWPNAGRRRTFSYLASLGIALLVVAGWFLAYGRMSAGSLLGGTAVPANPNAPAAAAAGGILGMQLWALGVGAVALAVFVAAVVIALRDFGASFRPRFPAWDLLIILGTFVLPQLTAFPESALGWNSLDYSNAGLLHTAIIFLPLLAVSIIIGLWWDRKLWLINAVIFYSLFIVFYTTFFTNGGGLASGLVGSLGYWLEQQGVRRGSQPWYYYLLVTIPIYEYLPALASLVAGYFGLRQLFRRAPADREEGPAAANAADPPDGPAPAVEWKLLEPPAALPESAAQAYRFNLPGFLGYWSVASLLAYTVAGEKMPWLTVHIVLAMILLGGWALGRIWEQTDWRQGVKSWGWLGLVVLPLTVYGWVLAILDLLGTAPPFAGSTLDQLQATTGFVEALVFAVLGTALMVRLWRSRPPAVWGRMVTLELFGLLAVLTLRAGWMASYINLGDGKEFIDYAHSTQSVKTIMAEVQELSQRTNDGLGIEVAYDDLVSWPLTWYLRDYPNQRYFGDEPTRDLENAPIVLVGSGNIEKVDPLLSSTHYSFDYIRMSWPMQEYFNLDSGRLLAALESAQYRQAIFNIWFNRDYTLYGTLTGVNYDISHWPVSESMRVYIRKDIANQIWQYGAAPAAAAAAADPYAKGQITLAAAAVWGAAGSEPGQLQNPRGIAVAPDGSIYVADTDNSRIEHFDRSGNLLEAWGTFADSSKGPAPGGTFDQPWGVGVAPDGNVFVADTWNYRIQEFTADGKFVRMWGSSGQANTPTGFYGPRDVAVDSKGRVYVADTGNKRIVVFDENGNYLAQIGSGGFGPGQLDEPVGIALGPDGELYVADTWNQRVQVFRETSTNSWTYDRQWAIAGWNGQSLDNKPFLAVGSDGRVYVTDPQAYRVIVFNSQGGFLYTWGDYGTGSNAFKLPVGIQVDSQGSVWVVDSGNGRVMQFQPPSTP